jgi:hypothetical protein
MSSKPLIPQAFWFRVAYSIPRLDEIPRSARSEPLLDLPESCALTSLTTLDGAEPWAEVRTAWNPNGLGISVIAQGISSQQLAERPEGFASVQIWIDTRDTRNVSRATRFCHRYVANLTVTAARRALAVDVTQRPIARAVADAPLCPPDSITSRAQLSRAGWTLELFVPAAAMKGFEPEINRRFGFAYQVADMVREDQFLTVGPGFPVGENPSLWSTLELCD